MKPCIIASILLSALLATAVWALSPLAAAAQSSVSVAEQGVENQFPDGLRFYISADNASEIEEIRVYVQKLGQSTRRTYRTVEFDPGESISGEAIFRSKTANEFIPTGTRLTYHFDIRTADGINVETEPETIVYLNTGLDWQTTSNGLIDVYYYRHNGDSERRANEVLATAVDTYEFMAPALGVELTEPMSIVVYSDYNHMLEALQPASRVAARQLRTLGKAHTNERSLLVDGSMDNILSTAAHEFTHLLVADAAGSAHTGVHTWLNEGLAVYSERDPRNDFQYYLDRSVSQDDVPPLTSLITFAGTPAETLRNYGQGHSVVAYMIGAYGPERMAALFANLPTVRSTEKAIENAYGLTIHELDNEWRESVGLAARVESAPALPPLQVPATSRPASAQPAAPLPTPAPATSNEPAPNAPAPNTPTMAPASAQIAPTYTPRPLAQDVAPTEPAPEQTGAAPAGGCTSPAPAGSAGRSIELAALGLLAMPFGLGAIIGWRRRRK